MRLLSNLVFAVLATSLLGSHAASAQERLPERLWTTLVEPIVIGNSIDGQHFTLQIKNDELSSPFGEGAKLEGHLRIVTPDSRATKNQFVELIIDKLSTQDKSGPIKAELEILGNTLTVKNGAKTSRIKIERCHKPDFILGTGISSGGPISTSERRKTERLELKKRTLLKLAAMHDHRYGLEHAGQMVFLSTKANPFNLPAGQMFRVKLFKDAAN